MLKVKLIKTLKPTLTSPVNIIQFFMSRNVFSFRINTHIHTLRFLWFHATHPTARNWEHEHLDAQPTLERSGRRALKDERLFMLLMPNCHNTHSDHLHRPHFILTKHSFACRTCWFSPRYDSRFYSVILPWNLLLYLLKLNRYLLKLNRSM